MFTFIDNKTGVAFNGEQPYIFWFDNGQSTNLNYVRQICIFTSLRKLTVRCESPVFSILKMDQAIPSRTRTVMNGKKYLELEDLIVDNRDNYRWVSEGYSYRGNYVHMLYFLASSQNAGEFIDSFYIDDKEYSIGADFYNINELLQSNLENFGITLPESIQRAIYETNIHEESNDNVLLNRKYKELLMNYMDIVANKGSYASVINSLKWFEWGDLVRLEEVWEMKEGHKTWYRLEDINTTLSTYLDNMSKTTYIGVYFALHQLSEHNGEMIYRDTNGIYPWSQQNTLYSDQVMTNNDVSYTITGDTPILQTTRIPVDLGSIEGIEIYNEVIPEVENTIALWNNIDLCLKMTLLGSFYSTFFLPIHMDLLHSTIESTVFTNVQKILHASQPIRIDSVNLINTIDMTYEYK